MHVLNTVLNTRNENMKKKVINSASPVNPSDPLSLKDYILIYVWFVALSLNPRIWCRDKEWCECMRRQLNLLIDACQSDLWIIIRLGIRFL
jgi:hypothetical protein